MQIFLAILIKEGYYKTIKEGTKDHKRRNKWQLYTKAQKDETLTAQGVLDARDMKAEMAGFADGN